MLKKKIRYFYLISIYLTGMYIGAFYTYEVIAYSKSIEAQKKIDEQVVPQKRLKKKHSAFQRIV